MPGFGDVAAAGGGVATGSEAGAEGTDRAEGEAAGQGAEAETPAEGQGGAAEGAAAEGVGAEGGAAEGGAAEGAAEGEAEAEVKKEAEPFVVPTSGAFYMHDDRFGEGPGGGRTRGGRRLWESGREEKKWKHDLFEELEQEESNGFREQGGWEHQQYSEGKRDRFEGLEQESNGFRGAGRVGAAAVLGEVGGDVAEAAAAGGEAGAASLAQKGADGREGEGEEGAEAEAGGGAEEGMLTST
ncbi:unnamed protein product [Closterium sp. Yama58-4]|nr:unnamed protein product [Closterium sp. Yama58-4]